MVTLFKQTRTVEKMLINFFLCVFISAFFKKKKKSAAMWTVDGQSSGVIVWFLFSPCLVSGGAGECFLRAGQWSCDALLLVYTHPSRLIKAPPLAP